MEDFKNAKFREADFGGAHFHSVNFSNVKVTNAWLFNVALSGMVGNLSVNGVDVTSFVEAQLNERRNKLDLQINLLAEQEETETLKALR